MSYVLRLMWEAFGSSREVPSRGWARGICGTGTLTFSVHPEATGMRWRGPGGVPSQGFAVQGSVLRVCTAAWEAGWQGWCQAASAGIERPYCWC